MRYEPIDRFANQGRGIPEEELDALLRYIREYWTNNMHSPTYREMQDYLRLSSVNLMNARVKRLVERGKLRKAGKFGVIPVGMKVAFDD